jgi:hypothetical protein
VIITIGHTDTGGKDYVGAWPSNPRLQRTPLRAPVSREPLISKG